MPILSKLHMHIWIKILHLVKAQYICIEPDLLSLPYMGHFCIHLLSISHFSHSGLNIYAMYRGNLLFQTQGGKEQIKITATLTKEFKLFNINLLYFSGR